MPELPEVETIRNDLKRNLIGKDISRIDIIQRKSVRNSPDYFINALLGNQIEDIGRKGKFLFFKLKDGKNYLLAHLRMTGQLVYKKCDNDARPEKYSRIVINFSDNSRLYFNDIRRFGYLEVISEKQHKKVLNNLGMDPLGRDFTFKNLKFALKTRKATLKSVLLNQKTIAGIGNIYADEICFAAKLRPDRHAYTLNDEEVKILYSVISKILKKAIRHRGTTFSNYVDAYGKKGGFVKFLKIYKKEKRKCSNCEGKIEKSRIAGRSTRFCPGCQK